ncbi:uncharacterized protein DNG_07883 [Cephalotrichum gorgonifer]|uniref:Stress-response A/B barrel domain-containing protein n=1 Tax=Cephalotrichum gorgonifer TaxID=2041049 RepID=A0AAE8N3A7_9PEZI|nr:uncharacterized protein DNG_07883 [Cephalotrichum gorgonifer]
MGGIIHVVQLSFKPEVDSKKIDELTAGLAALKDQCVHPSTGDLYVQSVRVGADNSIERFQNGFTHMMVMEFKSSEDRDYYVKSDPAHLAFVAGLLPSVKGLQVLDIDA